MRVTLPLLLVALACGPGAPRSADTDPSAVGGPVPDTAPLPSLSAGETAAGFRLLFDGATTEGWRGYRSDAVPSGWSVAGGELAFLAVEDGRGDLVTTETFGSFELRLEWKVAEGGNSGIFFHVTEDHDWPWESGPEMQVLDNANHPDGSSPLTSAGSNYALHGPPEDVSNPAGEWNSVRLIVDGDRVEHWLNGVKVVEYTLGSADWEALVAASKFGEMADYGRFGTGHLALQDHGDPVWFRNIRLRVIDRAVPATPDSEGARP